MEEHKKELVQESTEGLGANHSIAPEKQQHSEDLYYYFLRYESEYYIKFESSIIIVIIYSKYYQPFLVRYHRYVLIGWVLLLGVCFYFGPKFLTNTRSVFIFIFTLL